MEAQKRDTEVLRVFAALQVTIKSYMRPLCAKYIDALPNAGCRVPHVSPLHVGFFSSYGSSNAKFLLTH